MYKSRNNLSAPITSAVPLSTRWPCDSCDSFATISWRWFIKIYTISLSFSFFLKNLHFSFSFFFFWNVFLGVRKLVNPLRIPYCLKPHLNIWIFSTLFKRFDSFSANVGIQVGLSLSLLHFTLNFLHYTFFFLPHFHSFLFGTLGFFFLLIWWGLHRCVPPSSRCTKRQRRGQQK